VIANWLNGAAGLCEFDLLAPEIKTAAGLLEFDVPASEIQIIVQHWSAAFLLSIMSMVFARIAMIFIFEVGLLWILQVKRLQLFCNARFPVSPQIQSKVSVSTAVTLHVRIRQFCGVNFGVFLEDPRQRPPAGGLCQVF